MLFARSIITLSCIVLSVVNAAPIISSPSSSKSYISEAGFLLTESLSEYYENIVDQVMLDVSEDVLTYLPQSISHGNVEARHLAQKSMNRNLNFMRASLLASVNPLVSTDIPQIEGLNAVQQIDNTQERTNQDEIEANLLGSIMTLNKKISHQLGLIVNAEQSSSILMRQATTQISKQVEIEKPTVVTVEWKLRQPFQINVIRQEEQQQQQDVTSESEWLYGQLSSVEINLLNEFNDRAQEAVQLVMESLALDV
ncbi:hypothetical protein V8B55DRAFT_1551863 [Mucor lusitanicus]|uniref:Uncharacterized protein n=2 Tax=Mucor circinelloides f. lusitanicus TaxID=29924 RepID=A0A168P363_MUCCL|nr:hypothetical protein FB192DRAFT_1397860 [Mucor lusitanicus]OAD07096.1 hypothetical protein MUCCIDRAFT_155472 [Mucor lusitanicus CBS 277.49]